jgi:glycosyltransferase involved in cell wall biosynthesis
MPNTVLLLAHDFPPMAGGGVTRPTAFAKYLPEFGYQPIILTRGSTHGRPVDHEPLAALPAEVRIERIDPDPEVEWEHFRRALHWAEPFERLLGKPANWTADGLAWRVSQWRPSALMTRAWVKPALALGAELIRRHRPSLLIATGPPFGTLKVGLMLAERFGLPLISDFRDPWTYEYLWKPRSRAHERDERQWERRVVAGSARVLVVTPSMAKRMREDYPAYADKVELLTNGWDEPPTDVVFRPNRRFTIAHVGTIVDIRQPTLFLDALTRLKERHPDIAAQMCVRFVGPSSPPISGQLATRNLVGVVEDVGPVSRRRSKEYMQTADVLLLHELETTIAIPGKCFEYLAARRPILAFIPEQSDVAWFLRQTDCATIVGREDLDRVVEILLQLWRSWRNGGLRAGLDETWFAQFHRRELTRRLASLLDARSRQDRSIVAVPPQI